MAVAAPSLATFTARRLVHADDRMTTVHVAVYPRAGVVASVVVLPAAEPLAAWCAREGVGDAIVGGFFVTPGGPALGDVRVAGRAVPGSPVDPRFAALRACLHLHGDAVTIGPRGGLPAEPGGDLLQAGPRLVADGGVAVRDGEDAEGFSAGSAQFDSDITSGRHPRSAVGVDADRIVAVVTEGRAPDEAGLTLGEMAVLMASLGCEQALNLDGGGSASLVVDGRLVNRPREAGGAEIPGGRPVVTALAFRPRAQASAASA